MHPYKPEKFSAQNANADAKNKLLCLGGNKDPKETGKKPVFDNVNLKPSTYEEMYDYVEGVHELDRRHKDDFPVFTKDEDGNLVNPNKEMSPRVSQINPNMKNSIVHQASVLKNKNNGKSVNQVSCPN
jgi:hypothetical protein